MDGFGCDIVSNIETELMKYQNYDDVFSKKVYRYIDSWKYYIEKYQYGNIIVHGDFTLNNIVKYSCNYYIIDLDTVKIGNIYDDVSSFCLSILYNKVPIITTSKKYDLIGQFLNEYFVRLDENTINLVLLYLKYHCIKEISVHAKNYTFLKRCPGMLEYLNFLLNVIEDDYLEEELCKRLLNN